MADREVGIGWDPCTKAAYEALMREYAVRARGNRSMEQALPLVGSELARRFDELAAGGKRPVFKVYDVKAPSRGEGVARRCAARQKDRSR